MSSLLSLAKSIKYLLKGGWKGRFSGLFVPTPALKHFFTELCDAFTRVLIHAHFDPASPICHRINALGYATTSIILQRQDKACGCAKRHAGNGYWLLVASWSYGVLPAGQDYAIGSQEMVAIVMSCCHWCHYLEGARYLVEVLTNQYNFKMFKTTKSHTCWQGH
jgi:hypothetical protein